MNLFLYKIVADGDRFPICFEPELIGTSPDPETAERYIEAHQLSSNPNTAYMAVDEIDGEIAARWITRSLVSLVRQP